MALSKDDFQSRVKRIFDRWYFTHDRQGQLLLMEKPYIRQHGGNPWVVDWWPKDTVFKEKHVRKLKWMHAIRLRGLQKKVISDLTGRNKMRQQAQERKFKRFHRETFASLRSAFKKDAASMGVTRAGIRNSMKDVSYGDTGKVLNKVTEYAEKYAAGQVPAMHTKDILETERKIASGEMKRLVPS